RPALADRPKVLAPVGERPFISFLLNQLAASGFDKVVLLIGYQAGQVRRALGSRCGGLALAYSREVSPLGTAGALRNALPQLDAKTILLMNGDSFCEVDLVRLVAEHRRRRADLSMVLAKVADASRFGHVRLGEHGRITHFVEKQENSGPGWINAGICLLQRSLVEEIPVGRAVSLERDMLPLWLTSRRVYGFQSAGRFLDIGTPASYASASRFFTACD